MQVTGIISALQAEANCLADSSLSRQVATSIDDTILLVLSGMGKNNVELAIDSLLKRNVSALISFGTAAALSDKMKSGDIFLAEEIIDESGQLWTTNSSWCDLTAKQWRTAPSKLHRGRIYSANTVITTAEAKTSLGKLHQVDALDMESAIIAQAAEQHALPVLVIRIIIDEHDVAIPADILAITDEYGELSMIALLGRILSNPGLIPHLFQLGKAFRAAKRTMVWIGKHRDPLRTPE